MQDVLHAILSLAVIIPLIIALVYLLKRMSGSANNRTTTISIEGELSLGSKERLVLVRVKQASVLLGVTRDNIVPLHTLSNQDVLEPKRHMSRDKHHEPA